MPEKMTQKEWEEEEQICYLTYGEQLAVLGTIQWVFDNKDNSKLPEGIRAKLASVHEKLGPELGEAYERVEMDE